MPLGLKVSKNTEEKKRIWQERTEHTEKKSFIFFPSKLKLKSNPAPSAVYLFVKNYLLRQHSNGKHSKNEHGEKERKRFIY